jgi:bifunctional non-homologous end joining protein LigD
MPRAELPDWLEPMAATLTQERFTGPHWTFERKLDGIRLLAYKDDGDVTLMSRNRLPQNHAYPSVVEAVRALPVHDVILDGEALGVWGKQGEIEYHVFDVLWLDGRNVCALPLIERRALLAKLPFAPPLHHVEEVFGDAPWDDACAQGWEGVIAKRRDAPYEHRRSKAWLKMKCEASQELVVGGFTDPQNSRVGLGALLVGYFEDGDFVYAGKVGTGFNTRLLRELRERLDKIEIDKPPFTRAIGLPNIRAHWVRPEVVVQVGFMEWTKYDKLRHPRLLGLRIDKAPQDVVRERPS